MNKQNKILLGILAFVVACTIGYALFSETITINGTATAKGDFEVTATCIPGLTTGVSKPEYSEGEGGYSNDSCTVTENTVTYATDLLYPTAERLFTIKMTNTGSIDALLPIGEDFETAGNATIYNADGTIYKDNFMLGNEYQSIEFGAVADSDGTIYNIETLTSTSSLLDKYLVNSGEDVKIEPGESVYFVAMAQYDDNTDADNPNNILKRTTKETKTFTFNFRQPSE